MRYNTRCEESDLSTLVSVQQECPTPPTEHMCPLAGEGGGGRERKNEGDNEDRREKV